MYNVFGWIATILTFIYKFPQVVRIYQQKTVRGLSIISFNIQAVGSVFYIVHGIIIDDYPVILMGSETFVLNVIICMQYYYYNNLEKKNQIIDSNQI